MRSTESRACNQCPQSKHPEFLVKSQSMNIIQFRYTASAYVLSNSHILLVLSLPPGSHPRNILTLTRDRRSHSQLAKVKVDENFGFFRSHSRGLYFMNRKNPLLASAYHIFCDHPWTKLSERCCNDVSCTIYA